MAEVRVVSRAQPLFRYEGGAGGTVGPWPQRPPGKGGSRWLPVRHPAVYAGEVFQTLCAAQGVVLPDVAVAEMRPEGRFWRRIAARRWI